MKVIFESEIYFETLKNTVILTLTNLWSYANINGNICMYELYNLMCQ